MRISDWSSDVCSSDLCANAITPATVSAPIAITVRTSVANKRLCKLLQFGAALPWCTAVFGQGACRGYRLGIDRRSRIAPVAANVGGDRRQLGIIKQIGRASCRERVCQYV